MYALASQSSAPWWGAPLIAALALLAGSGLTLLVTWLRGRTEQQLTDKRRWDDLILEAAVAVENICSELRTTGKFGYPNYIEDPYDRTERFIELTRKLEDARSRFRLVASEKLKDASHELYAAAVDEFLGQREPGTTRDFEEARKTFVTEVRRELRAN